MKTNFTNFIEDGTSIEWIFMIWSFEHLNLAMRFKFNLFWSSTFLENYSWWFSIWADARLKFRKMKNEKFEIKTLMSCLGMFLLLLFWIIWKPFLLLFTFPPQKMHFSMKMSLMGKCVLNRRMKWSDKYFWFSIFCLCCKSQSQCAC